MKYRLWGLVDLESRMGLDSSAPHFEVDKVKGGKTFGKKAGYGGALLKTAIVLVLIVFATVASFADTTSDSAGGAAAFLKIGVSARGVGMGGIGVADFSGADSVYWNPANIAYQEPKQDMISTSCNMPLDRSYKFFGFSTRVGKLAYAIGWGRFEVDDILRTDNNGNILGTFDDKEDAIWLSAGYRFRSDVAFGVSLKFLNQDVYTYSADGVGVDLGIAYKPTDKLSLGLSVSNIGAELDWDDKSENDDVPVYVRFGLVYDKAEYGLKFGLEVLKIEDEDAEVLAGVEKSFKDRFSIRLGKNQNGVTAGARIKINDQLKLDYAYAEDGLGNLHRVSVGWSW